MDFGRYNQSVLERYGTLQNRYVAQDAVSISTIDAQKLLFADRIMATWLPQELSSNEKSTEEREQQYRKKKVEKYGVIDGLCLFSREHVLLIGKPGSGKTTALQYLLLDSVQRRETLPILIELRSFSASVFQIALNFTEKNKLGLTPDKLREQLEQGQCLLLLDGLNELPSEEAQESLKQFLKDFKSCSVIATTRDLGLGGDFGIEKKLELQPLTAQQITNFVQAHIPEEEQSKRMLAQLKPRLREFQETPLLLLMLCQIFLKSERIPDNLGLAFRDFSHTYDNYFKPEIRHMSYCRYLLSRIAFKMLLGNDRTKPLLLAAEGEVIQWLASFIQTDNPIGQAEEWLNFLLKYHLLQRSSEGQVEFKHQLWQEYYAAEFLLNYLPSLSDEQVKANFLNMLKWTESLKLMLALVDSQEQEWRIIRLGLETDLLLGSALAGSVRKSRQKLSIHRLMEYKINIDYRHIDWQLWLLPSAKLMTQILLLSKSKSKYSIPYLRDIFNSEYPNMSRRASEALGKLDIEDATAPLIEGLTHSLSQDRYDSAAALGELGRKKAIKPLLDSLHDERTAVQCASVEALGKLRAEQAVVPLIEALAKGEKNVRERAAEALGRIGGKQLIEPLIDALRDEYVPVRWKAVSSLKQLGTGQAIDYLANTLRDQSSPYREHAAQMLDVFDSDLVVDPLLEALFDRDVKVRRTVANTLARLDSERTTARLIDALQDEDCTVRAHVARALGEVGDSTSIIPLINTLQDSSIWVGSNAAEALGKLGSEKAIEPLINIIENKQQHNATLRASAAKALGNLGSKQAVTSLIKTLRDRSVEVRQKASEALGKIGDARAINPIVRHLRDRLVLEYAAKALVRLDASEKTIKERSINNCRILRNSLVVPFG